MLTRKKYLTVPEDLNSYDADKILGIITSRLIDLDLEINAALNTNPALNRDKITLQIADELIEVTNDLSSSTAIDILASATTQQPLFMDTSAIIPMEDVIKARWFEKLRHDYPIDNTDLEHARLAANELVQETKKFSHALALFILTKSCAYPLFTHPDTQTILHQGIDNESHTRSPLSLNPATLEFVRKHQQKNPVEIDTFLHNPSWLLQWLDSANSLEASKFLHDFFVPDTELYLFIKDMQNDIHQPREQRHAARLLFALISPEPLPEGQRLLIADLLKQNNQFTHRQFQSIDKTLAALINGDMESIKGASGYYLNLNGWKQDAADLTAMQMRGAALNKATIHYGTLRKCNLKGAQMQQAQFSGCDFSNATLIEAKLFETDLSLCDFTAAKLQGADLRYANLALTKLRGADLTNAVMENTNLQDADFFSAEDFSDATTLTAELNHLHNMLTRHRYFLQLIDAITTSFINHTRSDHCKREDAVKFLELAHKHPLFSTHHEYNAGKTVVNAIYSASISVANTFSTFFNKEPQQITPRDAVAMETRAQEILRNEIVSYLQPEPIRMLRRPPPPTNAPVAPQAESMRNSK